MITAMLISLQLAARRARQASTIDGRRTIEILLTEEGIVARGTVVLPDRERASYSGDVPWPSVDGNPDVVLNMVRMVEHKLLMAEGLS